MKKQKTPRGQRARLTKAKRRSFAVIALLLPLVVLLAVEGVLRLLGHGGYDPVLRIAGEVEQGRLVLADQTGVISYFYANPSRPGFNNQYQFIDPKPDGVFRVFIVGESTAKGYPEPRNLASSAFLQAMLSDAWPDRTVEVINLGTTAIASFPVLEMMKEALEFEPDLVVIHTGHNEFFGAYGVNSISRGGGSVARLKMTRFIRSLALVQALEKLTRSDADLEGKSLMEIMVGESYTAPDDPSRTAAANNLEANLTEMLLRCKKRGVPAMVCTLPSNQRDLYPIGADSMDSLSEEGQTQFQNLLNQGASSFENDPASATVALEAAVSLYPQHARARFLLGRVLYSQGQTNEAQEAFVAARDLDSMPWRTTTQSQQAIRKAAATVAMPLCDMEADFRAHSPGGCVGWELMADHVHPSLRGQALMAESIVATLHEMTGRVALSDEEMARIRPWTDYAEELGENPYDRYGVNVAMLKLFNVPFVRERNAEARRRYEERVARFESKLSPKIMAVVQEWKSVRPHAGGKRPITGMIARQLMREKRLEEALELYRIAQRSVPEYTSWHMEYTYFALACREKLQGGLSEDERDEALREIDQGRFLLQRGFSQTGLTERYVGRLYQLRGEWTEAIPFLNASREKLGGFDLVAADQALFMSLIQTDRRQEARNLAEYGAANSGQYTEFYQQMLQLLDEQKPSATEAELDQ